MSKQSFNIGDKVRILNIEDSHGYDVGVGEVTEIFIDAIWDEEEDVMIETGDEILQVYFPKVSATFTLMDKQFVLA